MIDFLCGSALLLVTYVNIYSLNLTSEQYGNFFKATRNIIQKLTERFNTDFFYLYMYTLGVSGGRGRVDGGEECTILLKENTPA